MTQSTIISKIASKFIFLSLAYLLCFGIVVIILGIYALLWQQILKNIPLSVAISNKPITLVFTTLWSYFIFGEIISIRMIVGIMIILLGIYIVGRAEYE